jgi:hypothetical protein
MIAKTTHWQGAGRTATADAGSHTARGKKRPMFVVPALAGIWAENRLKAGLRTATADAGRKRSPRRSACTAPWFAAICSPSATHGAAGIPPILRRRELLRWQRTKFNPQGSQFDPRHPSLEETLSPEEAAAYWNERRIHDPLSDRYGTQIEEVFDTQFNAIQCNFWQFFANARNFAKIHENHCKFPQVSAGPRNCRRRRATHLANWTCIAGYAPLSVFRTRRRGDAGTRRLAGNESGRS